MPAKDEYLIILDFFPHGKPGDKRAEPLAQGIGQDFFNLLEVVIKEGKSVKPLDKVYIGEEKRDEVKYIRGRIRYEELTTYAKDLLEKVVEEIFDDPTTGYLRLFVVGNESVWVTIKKGNSTYFSKELKPGLAPYKLYYFKEPNIQTQYSMQIPSDSTIVIGKPGYVYFLVYGVGTSKHPTKVVQWKESRIDNLAKDFSLYIPK